MTQKDWSPESDAIHRALRDDDCAVAGIELRAVVCYPQAQRETICFA